MPYACRAEVAGKSLRVTWYDSANHNNQASHVYQLGTCNPLNCSNSACMKKLSLAVRNEFCNKYGDKSKNCPGLCAKNNDAGGACVQPGRHPCYGEPCTGGAGSACTAWTEAQIVDKVIAYLQNKCGANWGIGPEAGRYEKIFIRNGVSPISYKSAFTDIPKLSAACKTADANVYIQKLADSFRCSNISDKAFALCRGGCPGGTCAGRTCTPPTKLNANNCNCDPQEDPFTGWFKGACHAFDFLPWGGCQKETQTVIFGGAILLGIVLLFTILRR